MSETGPSADGDAPVSEGSTTDGEVGETGEAMPAAAGPRTGVMESAEVLTERRCDLDGDGSLDNAVADLGAGYAELLAGVITTTIASGDLTKVRPMAHVPWVEDLARMESPSAMLAIVLATDTDVPADPSDDTSGDEPFYASLSSLDECAEPRWVFPEAPIVGGVQTAEGGLLPLPFASVPVVVHCGEIEVRYGVPDDDRATADICTYIPVKELGDVVPPTVAEESMLEILLAGGSAFGLSGVPGLAPDVDVDGDGLERFELDDEGRLAVCVDGDATVVEGRSCWRDERFADAVSVTVRMVFVEARLAGPSPGWRWAVDDRCDRLPPERSAWRPCEGAPACERWETRSCSSACGDEGEARCRWDCAGWTGCEPSGRETSGPASCSEALVEGVAACEDGDRDVLLVSGLHEVGGLRWAEQVAVGEGPIRIDARAEVRAGSSALPGDAWAVAAFRPTDGTWLSSEPASRGGASPGLDGYALEWRLSAERSSGDYVDEDSLRLSGLDGAAGLTVGTARAPSRLCVSGSSSESVVQALRLGIEPDIPETEANELVVVGQIVTSRGVESLDSLLCWGDGCPVQIRTGDVLDVAVTGLTTERDSIVRITSLDATPLSVDSHGLCRQ